MTKIDDLTAGGQNLVANCAGLSSDESVLIVREDPALGWYDAAAPTAVIEAVRALGIVPSVVDVSGPKSRIDPAIVDAVGKHDCTIFFARVGDQDRFAEPPRGCRSVMVYARDARSLASDYGRIDHRAMVEVKRCVNEICADAEQIEIGCRLGTKLSGKPTPSEGDEPTDVTVARFPLAVPAPVMASEFSGKVALAQYLTTTGSMPYEPAALNFDDVVFAEVSRGQIIGFSGPAETVNRIERHYDHVAGLYGLERNVVHSWHAGIHPACAYFDRIEDDPDRWSNNIFANPRYLHIHTCGNYAPGEICWMVLDPTVSVDGVNLWEDGKLKLLDFPVAAERLSGWPELQRLFDSPEQRLGV